MHCVELTLPELAGNLALDEALVLAAEEGRGEFVRFWEWPSPAVVLGAAGRLHDDVDVDSSDRDVVPIHRRSSGGGTVLIGQGCLCYALVLDYRRDSKLRHINSSYDWIVGKLARVIHGNVSGSGDLVLHDRKVGGCAQQRKRNFLLHHGTILYDFDLAMIPKYLREPPKRPEYRGERSHLDFVTNVPMNRIELTDGIATAFGAEPSDVPMDFELTQAIAERFGNREWIRRL